MKKQAVTLAALFTLLLAASSYAGGIEEEEIPEPPPGFEDTGLFWEELPPLGAEDTGLFEPIEAPVFPLPPPDRDDDGYAPVEEDAPAP